MFALFDPSIDAKYNYLKRGKETHHEKGEHL